MVLKVTTQGGAPQISPNMEPIYTQRKKPLVRKIKKRKHSKSHDPEEFNKSKPPTFNGEIKKGEESEVWLLGLKK
jgi:hypothetical protein